MPRALCLLLGFILVMFLACAGEVRHGPSGFFPDFPALPPLAPDPPPRSSVLPPPQEPLYVDTVLAVYARYGVSPKALRQIEPWVEHFTRRERERFLRYLERGERYYRFLLEEIRVRGMPPELVWLPLIESGYNPRARSRARAIGLWQFMKGTARKYGLRVDWWMDERYDPWRSTRAALAYLQDLYNQFGRWDLAVAAYNVGERKVEWAIRRWQRRFRRRGQIPSFWEIRRWLPRETRHYVPALLAVVKILSDPGRYGIPAPDLSQTLAFDTLRLPGPVDLGLVAEWAGVEVGEILALNPAFKRWIPPWDLGPYLLRLPLGTRGRVLYGLLTTPPDRWVRARVHLARKRTTLRAVARRYRVPLRVVAKINGLPTRARVRSGQGVVLPPQHLPAPRLASYRNEPDEVLYRVRRGDSLWRISRRFGVPITRIKRYNGLRSSLIRPGQRLLIPLD